MKQETFDKLQDLVDDINSSDGVGYSTFECEFLDNMQRLDVSDELSHNQETKIKEIWNSKIRYK